MLHFILTGTEIVAVEEDADEISVDLVACTSCKSWKVMKSNRGCYCNSCAVAEALADINENNVCDDCGTPHKSSLTLVSLNWGNLCGPCYW